MPAGSDASGRSMACDGRPERFGESVGGAKEVTVPVGNRDSS